MLTFFFINIYSNTFHIFAQKNAIYSFTSFTGIHMIYALKNYIFWGAFLNT